VDEGRPLAKAAQKSDLETLRLLLERGADPDVRSSTRSDGATPLALTVSEGWLKGAELLREHGADPSLPNGNVAQYTPLHLAVMWQQLEMVEWVVIHRSVLGAPFGLSLASTGSPISRAAPSLDTPELRRLLSPPDSDTDPEPEAAPK